MVIALLYGIYLYWQQRKRLKKEREERATLLAQAKEKERQLLSDNEYLSAQLRMQLIEKSGKTVRLPQNQLQLIAKIEKARRQFVQVNYYEPTLYDLADLIGETDEHIREAMIAMGGRVALDKPINDEEEDSESIGQLFSDDYYANDAELFEESRAIEINEALKNMFCERDQEIMKHFYGLFGYEPKTLTQLSEMFGLSDERVRQIVRTCTRQLRKAEALSDYQCA